MKRLALNLGIFFVLFSTMGVGISAATTFTVDSDGNGDYISIQSAVDSAKDGDIILVRNGPYKENIRINKQLTIKSNSDDLVIVEASNQENHVFSVSADNVVISGFNISGAYKGYKAGIFLDGGRYILISNNHVWHNYYGILLKSSQYNFLEHNVVWDNNYGFSFNESSDNVMTEDFAHNTKYGFILDSESNNNSFTSITASENEYGFYTESEKFILKDYSASNNAHDKTVVPPPNIPYPVDLNQILGIALATVILAIIGILKKKYWDDNIKM